MMKQLTRSLMPAPLWLRLSQLRLAVERAWQRCPDQIRRLGPSATATLELSRMFTARRPTPLRRLRLQGYRSPLYYRENTSDADVINQVFVRREYECIAHEPNVSMIIDCGANIGCTSYFLLHHYPDARLIAVEPDAGNMAVCRRNLRPFAGRVTFVQAGVWSTPDPLRVVQGAFRDGREWSFQVRPVVAGEKPDFVGTSIESLLAADGASKVDILKIDIEGAETEIFREGHDGWLENARLLAIELHGPECERAFASALSQYQWEIRRSGELTICRNFEAV